MRGVVVAACGLRFSAVAHRCGRKAPENVASAATNNVNAAVRHCRSVRSLDVIIECSRSATAEYRTLMLSDNRTGIESLPFFMRLSTTLDGNSRLDERRSE